MYRHLGHAEPHLSNFRREQAPQEEVDWTRGALRTGDAKNSASDSPLQLLENHRGHARQDGLFASDSNAGHASEEGSEAYTCSSSPTKRERH